MSKCRTKYCRGRSTKAGRSPYCSKCRSRRWKERRPLRYAFNKLRYRAKERKIPFNLTYEEYEKFAIENGYALLKGKEAGSFSIDRIDNTKGYEIGNIQCLTLADNSRKQWVDKMLEEKYPQETVDDDYPF